MDTAHGISSRRQEGAASAKIARQKIRRDEEIFVVELRGELRVELRGFRTPTRSCRNTL
jgi:hypothetical protein